MLIAVLDVITKSKGNWSTNWHVLKNSTVRNGVSLNKVSLRSPNVSRYPTSSTTKVFAIIGRTGCSVAALFKVYRGRSISKCGAGKFDTRNRTCNNGINRAIYQIKLISSSK